MPEDGGKTVNQPPNVSPQSPTKKPLFGASRSPRGRLGIPFTSPAGHVSELEKKSGPRRVCSALDLLQPRGRASSLSASSTASLSLHRTPPASRPRYIFCLIVSLTESLSTPSITTFAQRCPAHTNSASPHSPATRPGPGSTGGGAIPARRRARPRAPRRATPKSGGALRSPSLPSTPTTHASTRTARRAARRSIILAHLLPSPPSSRSPTTRSPPPPTTSTRSTAPPRAAARSPAHLHQAADAPRPSAYTRSAGSRRGARSAGRSTTGGVREGAGTCSRCPAGRMWTASRCVVWSTLRPPLTHAWFFHWIGIAPRVCGLPKLFAPGAVYARPGRVGARRGKARALGRVCARRRARPAVAFREGAEPLAARVARRREYADTRAPSWCGARPHRGRLSRAHALDWCWGRVTSENGRVDVVASSSWARALGCTTMPVHKRLAIDWIPSFFLVLVL